MGPSWDLTYDLSCQSRYLESWARFGQTVPVSCRMEGTLHGCCAAACLEPSNSRWWRHIGFNEGWFPSSKFLCGDAGPPSPDRASRNPILQTSAPRSHACCRCIKNALDGCCLTASVCPKPACLDLVSPGDCPDPTDLLVRTSRRAMVFKAEKPPSRLSRATPKRCRSTLSIKTVPLSAAWQ